MSNIVWSPDEGWHNGPPASVSLDDGRIVAEPKTPTTLEICTDCLLYLANGEVTDGDGNDITADCAAAMDAVWGDTDITLGRVMTEEERAEWDEYGDPEPWFSWRRCDGCDSPLGGNREYATAWTD